MSSLSLLALNPPIDAATTHAADLAASWAHVHAAHARSSVHAWQRRALAPPFFACFSAAHKALKRAPPPPAPGAPPPVARAFSPAGFHFNKAPPAEVVARFDARAPGGGALVWRARDGAPPQPARGEPLWLNVSPIWPGHCLYTPRAAECHAQVATPALFADVAALVAAMCGEEARAAAVGRGGCSGGGDCAGAQRWAPGAPCGGGFFAGFNSLGAHASVNHFHAHTDWACALCHGGAEGGGGAAWPPGSGLPCQRSPLRLLAASGGAALYAVGWAMPGLLLARDFGAGGCSGDSGDDTKGALAIGALAGALCAWLAARNVPHNAVLAAAPADAASCPHPLPPRAFSALVFPRAQQRESFCGGMGIALAEIAGLAICTEPEVWEGMTGAACEGELASVGLRGVEFEALAAAAVAALPELLAEAGAVAPLHCGAAGAAAATVVGAAPGDSGVAPGGAEAASGGTGAAPGGSKAAPGAGEVSFLARASDADVEARRAVFDELVWALPFNVGRDISQRAREAARGGSVEEGAALPANDTVRTCFYRAARVPPAHSPFFVIPPSPPPPPRQDLTYGETPFEAILRPLQFIARTPPGLPPSGAGVFVDIGCGTGKPLFAAALLHAWAACKGVEIVEELLAEAGALLEAWEGGLPYVGPKGCKEALFRVPRECRAVPIELYAGDATGGGGGGGGSGGGGAAPWRAMEGEGLAAGGGGFSWEDADVVYACATCFSEGLLSALLRCSLRMRRGSFFITSSSAFEHEQWEVLAEQAHAMSWGAATVFIQRKRA